MANKQVLVVGSNTAPTGGIQRYITDQVVNLPDDFEGTIYDTELPSGKGIIWLITAIVQAVVDALRYPFVSRPDIVHVHTAHQFSFYRASYYVLVSAYIWRCPVVLHVHGSEFDEFLETESFVSRTIQSITFATADEIIVLSEYWRNLLVKRVRTEKLTVLQNAVNPNRYDPSFSYTTPHIVFVSRLIERKGVIEFVEAVDIVLEETDNIQVSIAGDGPFQAIVEKFADRHTEVEYLGYISEDEKYTLLEEGTIYVLPTHAEGLPIAILEAMAGGNAIISTTVGSIPEVVQKENGVLVESGDVSQLIQALKGLLADPERTKTMAQNNREVIEHHYSWPQIMETLTERYEILLTK